MDKCVYCGELANTSGMCDPCDHDMNGRITGDAPKPQPRTLVDVVADIKALAVRPPVVLG